jgi:ribosome assembly protein 1
MGTYYAGDMMGEETRRHEAEKEKLSQQGNEQLEVKSNDHTELSLEDRDDSNIYFTPDSGNVIFASAIDGWAFSDNPIWMIESNNSLNYLPRS